MFIQPRREVTMFRWVTEGTDAHGNPVESWVPETDARVYGWEVPRTAEPLKAGHDRVTVDLSMFVPPGFEVSAHDRVELNGHTYEVVGEFEDAGNGPFRFNPGGTVQLRRVEG